jgi:sugar/nucleoside kinase (ribokinase family)
LLLKSKRIYHSRQDPRISSVLGVRDNDNECRIVRGRAEKGIQREDAVTRNGVDVVGIGSVRWDRYLVVPRIPGANEELRAIRSEECAGGVVPTALSALSRWGLAGKLVALLGHDDYSERICNDLSRQGLDVDSVLRRADAVGRHATIMIDNRNGACTTVQDAGRLAPLQFEDLPGDVFAGARVLLMESSIGACGVEAAQKARREGLKVMLSVDEIDASTIEWMRACDYVFTTFEVAQAWTEQEKASRAAYALWLQTDRPVVVTDGANGCYLASEDLSIHQPAYSVPVVDSTGAGEVFQAAFIFGLLSAWDVRKILRFAAWSAAGACREVGCLKGIPSSDDVHHFIRHDRSE